MDYIQAIITLGTLLNYVAVQTILVLHKKISDSGLDNREVKRILIVDDDHDITLSMKIILENEGFYVDTYNDPVKALLKFERYFYDLSLVDIRMPRLNGFEFLNEIRKSDDKIKICLMTAFEVYYKALKDEHPKLNVSCFIRKPATIGELLTHIKKELYDI